MIGPSYWYCGSTKWTAVTAWAALAVTTVGTLIRQLAAPTVGNERVWVCVGAGTTGAAEPSPWTFTKGSKTTDGTVTWMEVTGQPGVNGNTTDCQTWTANAKSNTVALGQVIYDSGTSSLQICTTNGTAGSGSAPGFSATAGVTTADNTVTWTSLGAASNFGTWAAPHARMKNAHTTNWMSAGNVLFISSNNAETSSAAVSITFQGTAANPSYNLSVDDTQSATSGGCTLLSGASNVTTGSNGLSVLGYSYVYGVNFTAGSSNPASLNINNGSSSALYLDTCILKNGSTGAASTIILAGSNVPQDCYVELRNCTFRFTATGQSISLSEGTTNIINGIFADSGSVPTTLFTVNGTSTPFIATIRDSDISAVTGTLLSVATNVFGQLLIEDSKLGFGVAMTTGTIGNQGCYGIKVHNCDSGSKNYRFYESNYSGTIQQETTTVDNTNPATTTDGTTYSWNIATSANTSFAAPYVSPEIAIYNTSTGSPVTYNIEIAGANTLTNGDIWVEIEYLGNASFPIASVANNKKSSIVASNTNVTTSTDSWGGSPAHTQKLQVTVTPQMQGYIKARVFVAKASTTVYVSPVIHT